MKNKFIFFDKERSDPDNIEKRGNMSKIIIGIHGMGNKPGEDQLSRWWVKAIREGLEGKGHFWFLKFKMVYWASVLNNEPLDSSCNNIKDSLYLAEPYIRAIKGKVPPMNSQIRKLIRNQINEQLDRIFLNDNGTLHFNQLTDFIIRHFVKDLDAYYEDSEDREGEFSPKEQICSRLAEVLRKNRKKKILLISHSMGSIITWDVLTKYVPEIDIHTLVTIGSPLGIPVVRHYIMKDPMNDSKNVPLLATPENISKYWYNLADFRDRVALSYDLQNDFKPNSRNVQPQDKLVWNNYESEGKENHHKSYGYLRCPEMSEILTDFLRSKRNS
jgi:hypothetical protein